MCTRRSPGIASPGFWLLGSLLCLRFATSMVLYNNGTSDNLNLCLNFSKQLMKEASESLNLFKKEFNCTMENLHIPNPKNEDKLKNACITRQSKTCMETIHTILASYAEEIKYSKSFGSPELLNIVNGMMGALKINDKAIKEASDKPPHSFSSQMNRCKFLQIFKQLTETIDRNLNYQNSPEPTPNC